MTMRERIANGKLFTDYVEGLPEDRAQGKRNMIAFNATGPDTIKERFELLERILGKPSNAWIEPPFYFCYGTNISFGEGCYVNMNCNFIDDGKIHIGNRVMFGPNVTIATVSHPHHPDYRKYMYADPVHIEDDVWIGAGSIIAPGVTIGRGSIVGAGSIVTRSIPAMRVAVGNPCRIIREITEEDRLTYGNGRPMTEEDLSEEARLAGEG